MKKAKLKNGEGFKMIKKIKNGRLFYSRTSRLFSNVVFLSAFLIFNFAFLVSSYAGGAVAKRQEGQKQAMQQRKIQAQQQAQQMQAQRKTQEQMRQQQQVILQKQQQERAIIERTQQKQAKTRQQAQVQVKDVVELDDLVASLEYSSQAWPLIIDQEAKTAVISVFVDQYRRQGVRINKSTVYYADLIDAMANQSPEMLNQPFNQMLKVLAILEYDFNNGQSKDDMALKVLGSRQAVAQNKKRLGM